jgi:hypothetical protein
MNHDLSYLNTPYAQQKMVECSWIEEREVIEKRKKKEAEDDNNEVLSESRQDDCVA